MSVVRVRTGLDHTTWRYSVKGNHMGRAFTVMGRRPVGARYMLVSFRHGCNGRGRAGTPTMP
eukprot:9404548-Pyramimonas_sp.AAC.1